MLCRNRLGYDAGLKAMAADPFYDADWKDVPRVRPRPARPDRLRRPDLCAIRAATCSEQRRRDPGYEPPLPPLFGEKEGKIARANIGRDPLYLFAALQRQLGYPEVPRPRPRDDVAVKVETLQAKVRDLEMRLKLLEAELRGTLDLNKLIKPELLNPPDDLL